MKVEHLGQIVDVDPRQAAFENKILDLLRKRGPTRQHVVYVTTGRHVSFLEVVESLVERNLIVRETTTRNNSFVLRVVYSGPNRGRVTQ